MKPIQLQKNLAGANYPCSKDDLVQAGKKNGADKGLVDQINKLPDKEY